MARPRKPTALLELTGAFKKDPQRKRTNEPRPNGPLGDEPQSFLVHGRLSERDASDRKELAAIWHELVALVPTNVLTRADRWLVELACRTMRDVRKGTAVAAERNLLLNCLSRMGLTPADRSRIAIPQEKEELDELTKLAAESRLLHRPN